MGKGKSQALSGYDWMSLIFVVIGVSGYNYFEEPEEEAEEEYGEQKNRRQRVSQDLGRGVEESSPLLLVSQL
jgi:hypothetical protein